MAMLPPIQDHKEGWLLKLGAVRKSWKKRYFVLKSRGGVVVYYEDSGYKKKMGTIVVNNSRIVTCYDKERYGENYAFGVIPPNSDREYVLRAKSGEERDEWINKFKLQGATTGELALKEGLLLKSGENMKSWKTRWFTLLHDKLQYFKKKGDTKSQGVIPLAGDTLVQLEPTHEKKYCFSITPQPKPKARKYLIVCATDGELQEWMHAIKIQVEMLKLVGGLRLLSGLDGSKEEESTKSIDFAALLGTSEEEEEKVEDDYDEEREQGDDSPARPVSPRPTRPISPSPISPKNRPTSPVSPRLPLPSPDVARIKRGSSLSSSKESESSPSHSRQPQGGYAYSTSLSSDLYPENSKHKGDYSSSYSSENSGSRRNLHGVGSDNSDDEAGDRGQDVGDIEHSGKAMKRDLEEKEKKSSMQKISVSPSFLNAEVVRQGWMVKLGGKVKNWRTRFFVLLPHAILYYQTKEAWDKGAKALAIIPFTNKTTLMLEPQYYNAFAITPGFGERKYIFITKDEDDRKAWTDDIIAQIQTNLEQKGGELPKTEGSHQEGELLKLGAKVKNWKKRYFVLLDDSLVYYKTKDDKKPVGTIKLSRLYTVGREPSNDPSYPAHLFSLSPTSSAVPNSRQYLLAAPDQGDRVRWMAAIKKRITAQEPLLEGSLWKQGAIRKNWQQRYFILNPSTLLYYKSKKDKYPVGIISISYQTLVEECVLETPVEQAQYLFSVLSTSGGRAYIIGCSSLELRNKWIASLQEAIQKKVSARYGAS